MAVHNHEHLFHSVDAINKTRSLLGLRWKKIFNRGYFIATIDSIYA